MVVVGSSFVDAPLNCFHKNSHSPKPPEGGYHFIHYLILFVFTSDFWKIHIFENSAFLLFRVVNFEHLASVALHLVVTFSSFFRFPTRTLTIFVAKYFVFNMKSLYELQTEPQANSVRIFAHSSVVVNNGNLKKDRNRYCASQFWRCQNPSEMSAISHTDVKCEVWATDHKNF